MAYTKIHGIRVSLDKALRYIMSPEKTRHQLLVSGFQVDPLSAAVEYRMTAALAREVKGDYAGCGGADILAYHMIQSFAYDDRITAEEAHGLGKKWADGILQGKHEYVISTHVDKGHIHNHVIFNSVSFYDFKKYRTAPYKTAARLREESDRLCAAQGLHVIERPGLQQKSPGHYEWEQRRAGTSWKAQIQDMIDRAVSEAGDYAGFKAALERAGVEVKEGGRISFRMAGRGQERFCRGDRIGGDYSRERIMERLAAPEEERRGKQMPPAPAAALPGGRQPASASYGQKTDWQARRAKLAATKELAAALLTIREEDVRQEGDFDIRVDLLLEKAGSLRSAMAGLADRNRQHRDVAKYLLAYRAYLPVWQAAERQKPFMKKRFLSEHESELLAFGHAAAQLERLGVSTDIGPGEMVALVRDQDGRISDLAAALQEVSGRIGRLRKARELVEGLKKGPETGQDRGKGQEI